MTPDSAVFVLDASVAAKWYLTDEDYGDQVQRVLTSFIDGEIALTAPQHIDYELANMLRTAARRGRIDDVWARTALIAFLSLPIEKVAGESLVLRGFDLSQRYSCAAYDRLYLALADELGCHLVHADRRLHNTLSNQFDGELWIERFPLRVDD